MSHPTLGIWPFGPGRQDGPAGPKPAGPAGPRPAGRPGTSPKPSAPPPPAPKSELPRLADVITAAESQLRQALAILALDVDPASIPEDRLLAKRADHRLNTTCAFVQGALEYLAEAGDWALAASLNLPARQSDSVAAVGAIATPGEPGPKPSVAAEKEPTPGSAAVFSGVARGSDGSVVAPVAGADFPSPGTGRPSGPVELSAPGRSGRSAGSAAHAPGADADFRLPRDVRSAG